MKMSRKKLHILHIAVGVCLLSLFTLLYFKVYYPTLPLINILNGTSTVVVAFFTCIYAIITCWQLGVMRQQLNEMGLARLLQNQPVLAMNKSISVNIEKPHLYSNPIEQTFEFASRCCVNYQVGNFSTNSAICVDMITKLVFQDGTEIKSRADRINVLNSNQSFSSIMLYPDSEARGLQTGKILNALIGDRLKLCVAILYRTVMGGYFVAKSSYRIMPKSKSVVEALEEWADNIKDAKIRIEGLEQRPLPERQVKYSDLRSEFDATVQDYKLDFYIEAISKEYNITNISSQEYERELTDFAACLVPIPSSHVEITDKDGAHES